MQDPTALVAVASTAIAGLSITSVAVLKAWQNWLDLKREEMSARRSEPAPSPVADLKARIRRLEAIANGIDL